MGQLVENIYSEISHLSDSDRSILYGRIQQDFHKVLDVVGYTADGKSITRNQYNQRIQAGIKQCMIGQSTSLEAFSTELGYNYADL